MRDLDHDADVVVGLMESRLGNDLTAGRRRVLAIAGPPGSGKSTLASHIVEKLNGAGRYAAAVLPMDGFHLDNAALDARALREIKGAPETFDAEGFVALVRRIRQGGTDIRYPLFDRAQDRTRPGAGCVTADTPLIVVEGNYLLLRHGAWADLRALFDVTVMLAPPLAELEARLVSRWLDHGLSRDQAETRARGNDLTNARTVINESAEADLILGEPRYPRGDAP